MNLDALLDQHIDRIEKRLSEAEEEFLRVAGERLAQISGLTQEQIREYFYSGKIANLAAADLAKAKRILDAAHRANVRDMSGLFEEVTSEIYTQGLELRRNTGQQMLPFSEFKQSFNPLLYNVVRRYEGMARSTTLNHSYKQTISHFVNRVVDDDNHINFPMAMRKAIRELTDQGISTIDYKGGRSVRMDSAVRNAMMTEYTQIVQGIQEKLGEVIGSDAIEISAHAHPADDHADIQGHIFTLDEWEKLQSGLPAVSVDIDRYEAGEADYRGEIFQIDRPIGMWNCRHIGYNFILGVSRPSHSKEQLEELEKQNEAGIEFHGKQYTLYEAEQEQRRLEREMRYEREKSNLYKQVKETDPAMEREYRKSQQRIAELRGEYRELGVVLAPHSMRMKMERASVPRGSTGGETASTPPATQTSNATLFNPVRLGERQHLNQEQARSNVFFANHVNNSHATISAVRSYNNQGYTDINRSLAEGGQISTRLGRKIYELDKITKLYNLDKDIIVYRGTDASFFQSGWDIGSTNTMSIFPSTSASFTEALGFANRPNKSPMMLELRVAKGTNGAYIGNNTFFKGGNQFEFLLGRDLKYTVIGRNTVGNVPYLVMEVRNE